MADRRAQQLNPSDGAGAPGSTGAFKTSDPLGAPGSTGAGLTHHDPTSIPGVGSPFQDTESDYIGGQHQPRNPNSGLHPTQHSGHTGSGIQQKLHDPLSGLANFGTQQKTHDSLSGLAQLTNQTDPNFGTQQKLHDPNSGLGQCINPTDPTSGVGLGSGAHQHQIRDPNPGIRLGGSGQDQHHHHLNPTAGSGYGGTGIGTRQHGEMLDPNSGVIGFDEKSEFARGQAGQGAGGVTGFTRVTTAAAPSSGGGMVYEREMAAARAEQEKDGGEEKKGIAEKEREVKDKIKGAAACGGHSR